MALDSLSKVTSSGISTTSNFKIQGLEQGITVGGIVTATSFVGDGSGLSGVVGSGSGVIVKDDGALVGTAGTINFGSNLSVSAISAGIVTVTGTDTNTTYTQAAVADGSNVNLRLTGSDSTIDDILLTAGTNITFSSVTAGGLTISASGGGGGGGSIAGIDTSGTSTFTNLNVTGVSTFAGITTVTGPTLFVKQLNASGVVTASSFVGALTGNVTGNVTGNATGLSGTPNITVGTIGATSLNVSGVSTFAGITTVTGPTLFVKQLDASGVVTATSASLSQLSVSGVSTTVTLNVGTGGTVITTTSAGLVGIGTTNPRFKLEVGAVGTSGTSLHVNGDTRITGILSIGQGTITLDGSNNQVNVGTGVTLHHTNGVQVGGNTLHSTVLTVNQINATGVVTATTFFGSLTGTATTAQGLTGTPNITVGTIDGSSLYISGVSTLGITTTTNLTAQQLNVSGVVTATSFSGSASNLTNITGASANTYGNETSVPQIVVDGNGRITSITNVAITASGAGGSGSPGIYVNDESLVGFAGTIDFGTGLSVTPLSAGIVTVTSSVAGIDTSGTSTFTNLNVTGVTTVAAGSTAAPSISPTGDSNTGIFFPAADTIAFGEGGSEALRIDSSGNVGIGITNPTEKLHVSNGSAIISNPSPGASGSVLLVTDDGTATTVTGGATLRVANDGSANNFAVFEASSTVSNFVITNAGNVGIGTTNPQSPLQVERYGVKTTLGTFNATAGVAVDIDSFTISVTDFKTAEYTLHIQHANGIQAQKVLVMQNGTTAYSNEYAIMYTTANPLVSVSSTISSGACKLKVTPKTGVNGTTTYRFSRETLL